MKKYILDANIYIDANRSVEKSEELATFYATFLPHTYFHAVVAQELLAGAVDQRRVAEIRNSYISPFESRGRLVTPSFASWARSGELVASLIARKIIQASAFSRSFLHDVLLAVSCREAGMTVVTRNTSDFDRIRRVERFDFVAPWPRLGGTSVNEPRSRGSPAPYLQQRTRATLADIGLAECATRSP